MRGAPTSIQGLIFVGLISVLAAPAAGAEVGRVTEGILFWRNTEQSALVPAPRLKTDVRIVVTGIVARASVRQEFTNPRPSAWSRSCSRPRLARGWFEVAGGYRPEIYTAITARGRIARPSESCHGVEG